MKKKMPKTKTRMAHKMRLSDLEWKKNLTRDQFNVLRKKGTEMPFMGKLLHNKGKGSYLCAGCGAEVFSSDKKFDSGTGWPSFSDAIKENITTRKDNSQWMRRIEVLCKRCGGHLGHVFDDGPMPTKKRYCINSCALDFKKK